ncbi:helix-turn-helix domain-containing protein [Thermophagus xiamenensis]|uniref:Transcriptional regulator, XRE family with cupin sensor n=1 Tax=Thermophagus xiamenensis TaxID=385682 RepID=A0A1I1ZXA9_9BACT|nr:XRE family transcriptional regulator [Thermophagus xiamenensis]SFE35293.1 transcriptional regulator, XRE family with cupin sensor [Thermophagus xiamenensis]
MKPGEKIKLQRDIKELTLSEVAQNAQIEEKLLVDIEKGEVDPPLGILIKLAKVLGVRPGTFLDDQQEKGVVVTKKGEEKSLSKMNASGNHEVENLAYLSLARQKSNRNMDPFLIEVLPDHESSRQTFSAHEGEEFIYVLKGSIEVIYGKEVYHLETGDSIYYDSIIDHRVKSLNNDKALVLAVVYLPV